MERDDDQQMLAKPGVRLMLRKRHKCLGRKNLSLKLEVVANGPYASESGSWRSWPKSASTRSIEQEQEAFMGVWAKGPTGEWCVHATVLPGCADGVGEV